MFHLPADVGRIAVQRQGFDGAEGVGLAGVADEVEEEIEGRRLAGGTEGAEEGLAELGVALASEGLFEERRGAGQAGRTERKGGLFGHGPELGLQELGHKGQGRLALQLKQVVEGLAGDFGFGVAEARL